MLNMRESRIHVEYEREHRIYVEYEREQDTCGV